MVGPWSGRSNRCCRTWAVPKTAKRKHKLHMAVCIPVRTCAGRCNARSGISSDASSARDGGLSGRVAARLPRGPLVGLVDTGARAASGGATAVATADAAAARDTARAAAALDGNACLARRLDARGRACLALLAAPAGAVTGRTGPYSYSSQRDDTGCGGAGAGGVRSGGGGGAGWGHHKFHNQQRGVQPRLRGADQ